MFWCQVCFYDRALSRAPAFIMADPLYGQPFGTSDQNIAVPPNLFRHFLLLLAVGEGIVLLQDPLETVHAGLESLEL